MMATTWDRLFRETNQAQGLAEWALEFLTSGEPSQAVLDRVQLFHTDAALCGMSALAYGCRTPLLFQEEAIRTAPAHQEDAAPAHGVVPLFGTCGNLVLPQKAALAGCSAVREWDSNGTNFGYKCGDPTQQAGEFGHNDYYSAVMAACHDTKKDGQYALRGMLAVDEIRDALARVYSLKTYKIDHVLHGGIAVAVVVGAIYRLTPQQIESAVGQVVAHHVPTRAIRHGHQLSDSKGSSAAIITEAAYEAVMRAQRGFVGPMDIFRNPEAIFWLMKIREGAKFVPGTSPFELELAMSGDGFAIMGMHFKLGVYEHQSAGAIQALIRLFNKHPELTAKIGRNQVRDITVKIYGTAHHIISDPHKWTPTTRQSADHSMPYILSAVMNRALEQADGGEGNFSWQTLMPLPEHYGAAWLHRPSMRNLMRLIKCVHEPSYDSSYPDGIPTSIVITDGDGAEFDSGLVMYPGGHARNCQGADKIDLTEVLKAKHLHLATLAVEDPQEAIERLNNIANCDVAELANIYEFDLRLGLPPIDG